MKTIIMPGDYFNPKNPDSSFKEEYNSAKKFGNVFLFCLEEFIEGDVLKRLPQSDSPKEEIFYHGWMMSAEQYRKFYLTLEGKGYRLTNPPAHHTAFNYFNGWYSAIEGLTPKSVMVYDDNVRAVLDAAMALQKETKSALIIKDAVKSLKHDWLKACFIPEGADALYMAKVIATFLMTKKEYNDLKLPVVIRQFEKLVSLGAHPKSGMPISHEYRTYVHNGKVLLQAPYWETAYQEDEEPPAEFIQTLIDKLMAQTPCKLFTIDTALRQDGEWICIEVGDGQVSSLPDQANKDEFFSKLLGDNNE